jgi:maltooligosyltrehalose trehalohydrolase
VAFTQNHDQVGNRAQGERSSMLLNAGRLRIAAALVACAPFVPLLFQGEEWGASSPFQYFTDHPDPDLGRAVTEGRRREFEGFGWAPAEVPDPQDEATWRRSVLRWEEAEQGQHADVLEWYRRLIALRRTHADLTEPRLEAVEVRFDEEGGWIVMARGRIRLVVNVGAEARVWVGDGTPELLLGSDRHIVVKGSHVELPRDSVAVLEV